MYIKNENSLEEPGELRIRRRPFLETLKRKKTGIQTFIFLHITRGLANIIKKVHLKDLTL